MRFPRLHRKVRYCFRAFYVLLLLLAWYPVAADGKQRHAFIVGVGDYDKALFEIHVGA